MVNLTEQARALNRRYRRRHALARALPPLILLTDSQRLPNPEGAVRQLPRGAAVIVRHPDRRQRQALARRLLPLCRQRGIRLLIADDFRLARRVAADGLHLPERSLYRLAGSLRRPWPGFMITAATHQAGAVALARRFHLDGALISPVFATASHPDAATLGIGGLMRLAHMCPRGLAAYALGGVGSHTVGRLSGAPIAGIAAIAALSVDTKKREQPEDCSRISDNLFRSP